MLLFWKWKEIYCGTSFEQFSAVRNILNENKIKYSNKLKKHDEMPPFRSPVRNTLGRVGENMNVATIYYIYVVKADYEKAKYVCRGAK